ncbi:hypothetical protein O9K51_07145 [Purpureocillium lavendulum]|uniref:Uncharacterized protein n=1 Tax=Purpureocillium lavendulum TaxID=1247861 RepID=A0AB34FLX1_9HYPO|nr:hypothetical protein O9K51_07145 [Purpureocillium lavendulum]
MMFSLKHVIFFGLLATSAAQPTLDPRAKVKEINCDGTEWSKDQINHSKRQARDLENSGYAYPKKFGNKDASGNDIFGAKGQLWEFPLTDPLWTNGVSPGTFRVIVKDNYDYVGVTNKDAGTGGTVHKC